MCEYAVKQNWVLPGLKNKEQIVEALRKSVAPVFVPLNALPDPATITRLRAEFPRMLFMAPRPPHRTGWAGDELLPDPLPEREKAEYQAWELAMNAIENS